VESLIKDYELDHLETIGRKDGILYVRKGYRRKRDLLLSLLNSIDRTLILITVGRDLIKMEEMEHPNLRSVINVKEGDTNEFLNWSDGMESFRYLVSSVEEATIIAKELAQRGDIVLFSPYGNEDEVRAWFDLFKSHVTKVIL